MVQFGQPIQTLNSLATFLASATLRTFTSARPVLNALQAPVSHVDTVGEVVLKISS